MKNSNSMWQVIKFMLKTAKEQKPILFFTYFLMFIAELLRKIQTVIIPKFLIDELVLIYNGDSINLHIEKALIFAAVTVALQFTASIIQALANRIQSLCDEFFNEYFQVKVNDLAMGLDYQLTEDPAALDQLNKAKDGISWYSGNVCGILNQFFDILTNAIVFISIIAVVFRTSPWIIPVELAAIGLDALFNRKIRQIELKSFEGLSKSNRVFGYIFYHLSDFTFGKDIRLYNSAPLFAKKAESHLNKQIEIWTSQAEGSKKQQYCINLVDAAANFITYFYIGFLALKRLISIGDFSMCVSASSTLTSSCDRIIKGFQEIIKRSKYAQEFLKFAEYPQAVAKGNKSVLPQKEHVIQFKDVSFRYPRSEKFILNKVNLTVPEGQHLAIVGLNGEGKTTLIKLLCRLYDVTEGEILIDGINIKEYKEEEYRKLFAVLFQDFSIFAFSVKENIAFGDEVSDEKIDETLKLAGLYDYVSRLPQKNQTCINKSYDKNGTDFSGGQKQKVGIARALYKNAPVIILDEPTAALDPVAEADIYSKFNTNLAGGKTAIYISHRLSSCKFCDKIAVISNGTIKEYGNHNELMKMEEGIYRNMFTTQAKQYQKQIKKE